MSDYYSTLGVGRDASLDEIKRAYRRAASQHHPDKGGSKEQFQKIQEAYDTLGDEQKRAQYDNPGSQFGPGGVHGFPGGFHFNFGPGGFNFNDIFGQFHRQHQQQRSMMRMSLWIRLHDVAVGGRRPVSVASPQGTATVEIEIPQGINDGDTIRYHGIAPGGHDLAVQFRIHPDPYWQRDGLNLIKDANISVWDLILGKQHEFSDITGQDLTVTIPPRTQPRTMLRVRGRGLRDGQGQAGDLLIRVNAQIPDVIDPEIIAAIQKHRV